MLLACCSWCGRLSRCVCVLRVCGICTTMRAAWKNGRLCVRVRANRNMCAVVRLTVAAPAWPCVPALCACLRCVHLRDCKLHHAACAPSCGGRGVRAHAAPAACPASHHAAVPRAGWLHAAHQYHYTGLRSPVVACPLKLPSSSRGPTSSCPSAMLCTLHAAPGRGLLCCRAARPLRALHAHELAGGALVGMPVFTSSTTAQGGSRRQGVVRCMRQLRPDAADGVQQWRGACMGAHCLPRRCWPASHRVQPPQHPMHAPCVPCLPSA